MSSAEVGVATIPLFVPRLVAGEEEAADHRVGFSRPKGAPQRWASWEAGFVPDGVCAERAFDVRHSGEGEKPVDSGNDAKCPSARRATVVGVPIRCYFRGWIDRTPGCRGIPHMVEPAEESVPGR